MSSMVSQPAGARAGEEEAVGTQRAGRQADVGRRPLVASGSMSQSEDGDLGFVLHGTTLGGHRLIVVETLARAITSSGLRPDTGRSI